MFIPRGDRDLGLAYQTHPGNQASSRGEAKNSAVLLSRDGYLFEPTVCPKGSQASCAVWLEDSGFLSRPCRKRRPSSCDDGGTPWRFSSCGGILEFRRGIQSSSCVGPGKSYLPFEFKGRAGDCSRVTAGQNRPHLGLCPGLNARP